MKMEKKHTNREFINSLCVSQKQDFFLHSKLDFQLQSGIYSRDGNIENQISAIIDEKLTPQNEVICFAAIVWHPKFSVGT